MLYVEKGGGALRHRLFRQIFVSAMTVFLICTLTLAVCLYHEVEEVGVVQLFMPLLMVNVAAVVLSLVFAHVGAKETTHSLDRIDLSNPDERDVEEELKPLVRRLAAQNRQIRSQIEALEAEHAQQDNMRRDFTANVSHELKTPLTSISGFAELMRDGMVQQEDVPRFAGKIYDEAQRMIVLVGDIIRLSKLEDPTVSMPVEAVSLRRTAERVLQRLAPAAERMEVQLSLSGSEGQVMAIPQVVEEILYNLCDNAIRYNRTGGSVSVQITEGENATAVTVTDTGIGIPVAEQERIFERFYRVDKSHSRELGGTGLGLSIVKHGAAVIGAKIDLESREGSGTRISVSFSHRSRTLAKEGANDHI